jgi:hypothetical protein
LRRERGEAVRETLPDPFRGDDDGDDRRVHDGIVVVRGRLC